MFYDEKTDSYAYYDTNSYDVYNKCRNIKSLLLKLDVIDVKANRYSYRLELLEKKTIQNTQ